jgi:hypothetical protein
MQNYIIHFNPTNIASFVQFHLENTGKYPTPLNSVCCIYSSKAAIDERLKLRQSKSNHTSTKQGKSAVTGLRDLLTHHIRTANCMLETGMPLSMDCRCSIIPNVIV